MPSHVLSNRWAQLGLAATAVAAVLVAPLATNTTAKADAVTIAGARSLSDQVSVQFEPEDRKTMDVHLLAYNDFHGTLEPGSQSLYGQFTGGAAYLAKVVKAQQARYGANQATVFAGDGIGASPLANSLFHEEPATIVANLMHTDFASVGNHEFDKGSAELKRIQNGGCQAGGCTGAPYALANGGSTNIFPGAKFTYLSANVVVDATGKTLFPAVGVKQFPTTLGKHKVSVGFIGEVLKDTPTIVTPTGVAGLTFQDEADAANRAVAKLRKDGVKTSVLVIHQGGSQSAPVAINGCNNSLANSPIVDIAKRLDPSIKVIISAHTHAEYRCTLTVNGVTRLITSASSFGRVLSDITLKMRQTNGELVSASATNILVTNALNTPAPGVVRQADTSKEDPQVAAVVAQYVAAAAPLANRVIGKIQGDLTRIASPLGETTLGDVIADAQYVATAPAALGGAQLAFMNPGGVRADLLASAVSSGGEAVGEVTYGEAFTVQPFGNSLVTKTMTGDQIHRVLEQQFTGCGGQISAKTLQISSTLKYESAPAAATCAAKIGRIWVAGVLVNPTDTLRVTMNNFIATGGDGFTVFNEGTNALGGAQDIDAFVDYFTANAPAGIPVPALGRIVPVGP
ncbi:MAG: bifunctional metallophosphatase/5-nucleotidase [Pseudonocardiales bacterium]|jgi:5'-nucleotidase|nr:bifunctional metallophosphatase/5-nucleotidase [Pseudonocardiales bacterium]